jgi:YD repeat-containing protein
MLFHCSRIFGILSAKIVALLILAFASVTLADEVNYSYDDAGRLVRVAKDTERILYQYDEVGNLLAIFRETGAPQALAPTLQGIDPDSFIIGDHYSFSITGQNLLTTNSVTSDNPAVTIKNITVMDTRIVATLSVAAGASSGASNITVTTSYGSASLSVGIYQASITPQTVMLLSGGNASFSVSLTPAPTETILATIKNRTPGIIATPSSVAIPAGGNADFTVNASHAGAGVFQIGSAEAMVEVIGGGLISSAPVSVSIGTVPNNALIYAPAVSVSIGGVYIGSVLSRSNPVSVVISGTSLGSVLYRSNPVSVMVGNIFIGPVVVKSAPVSVMWPIVSGAMTVSEPVCVQIEH